MMMVIPDYMQYLFIFFFFTFAYNKQTKFRYSAYCTIRTVIHFLKTYK